MHFGSLECQASEMLHYRNEKKKKQEIETMRYIGVLMEFLSPLFLGGWGLTQVSSRSPNGESHYVKLVQVTVVKEGTTRYLSKVSKNVCKRCGWYEFLFFRGWLDLIRTMGEARAGQKSDVGEHIIGFKNATYNPCFLPVASSLEFGING